MRAISAALLGLCICATCSAAATSERTMTSSEIEAKIVEAGRPRLFFQADGLARLKEEIRTTKRAEWERLKVAGETAPDIQPLKAGQVGAKVGQERIIFDPEGKRPPRRESQ
jgi:hypothetical protein